ncbi:dihydrolipoamide dehydrogenase mitochondrial precursor [Volvox carteri f. nagariensis]|uniref:Dihydrolipoamide dehydrogenase mitochondrial n=1 Tax=Volvox carteri f. nagariensis TaxID=3068 RepID=D8U8G0_VOLCA|nr:dihydrolipoamide dehydrogenase mitochondrial precursor [Volvox carteri f. nagariensis]EFJ43919.1 dihydrolipoamide dehydrogenase mitochondrial precursor [Volvox carteri f. nagariensis]|eukprot:XP_002954931.1 dihydrolipoamide dehydrogenase mitochondrial precursor [Volvox carteri f. nagariensis]
MVLPQICARRGGKAYRYLAAFLTQQRAYASAAAEKDLVVIGGGPGGYVAAIKAGQLGLSVACVEGRGALGGTCLNVGCIPSKALLNSSHKYAEAKSHFAGYGIKVGDLSYDFSAIQKQKDTTVAGLTKGIEGLFKKNKVDYVKGWGKLVSGTEVEVAGLDGTTTRLKAKNILLATGSEVTPLPGVPIDEEKIVSSTGALALKSVPKELVVIGAGYIGLEMGSVYQRLGAKVGVVEFLDTIVPSMDSEVRRAFHRTLEKQGLRFKMNTKVTKGEVVGGRVKLTLESSKGGAVESMECDVCLVAIGRRPYTQGLGLEQLGIKKDARGRVEVDSNFRTNIPTVYAIGDIIKGPMLAHKAEEDGVAAVAYVGLTEDEAKAKGLDYKTGKFSFMANSRARAVGDTDGMVKIIAEKGTDKLLGMHIMGPNAGEMIHEGVLALEYGASAEDIARTCHGHPTLSEAVKEAALATAFGKPIHM